MCELKNPSLALTAGHVVNDMFTNLLSGLLPVFTSVFALSYMLAGLLVATFNVTSSLLQPLLGSWCDRRQVMWLLEGGLCLNCICMSLTGISPNFVVLLFLVGTAGLGTAAFHPSAFSAVLKSNPTSKGGSIGVFVSGGNAGFFLGPLIAGGLVSTTGLNGTLMLIPVGLLAALLLTKARSAEPVESVVREQNSPANRRLLGILAAIAVLRSTTIQGTIAFLPLYFVTKGNSLLLATAVASVWLGVGVLGQITGGYVSDRIGRRPVIVFSLLVGGTIFYGFLMTSGILSILLLILSGAVLFGSWSVIVAMASESAPRNLGAVAGLMLGLSVGVGGVAALGFGVVADLLGLYSTFYFLGGFAFVGGLVAFILPK
jgi:FSR family fosmidomycin resistance protein-like MFS transporter